MLFIYSLLDCSTIISRQHSAFPMLKRKAIKFVMVATVAVMLLAGCHRGDGTRRSSKKETEMHVPDPIDTSAMDEEFYRRMRRFEALHPENVPLDR